jgi:hypothetical protein
MLSDSLFSDAGWLFFVIWSIVVGIFSVAAFRGDLLHAKSVISPSPGASGNKTTHNRSRKP